jgi:hypothetical protein
MSKGGWGVTDMTDKALFIEEILLNSVEKLLLGRVNELLGETEYPIPPIEFRQGRNSMAGGYSVAPVIVLSDCEGSEKERIIRLDVYSLTITFTVPEYPSDRRSVGERNCYAYAGAVGTALGENPTLGGIASRAVLAGKKYIPPKQSGTGGDWGLVLTLRITTEGAGL